MNIHQSSLNFDEFSLSKKRSTNDYRSCTHVFLFFSRDGEPFFQVVMTPSVLILLKRCRALAVRWRGIPLASRLPKCQRSTRGFYHCQNCRCLAKRGELRDRDEATYQTRRRRSFLVTPLPIYGKCPIKGRDISGWCSWRITIETGNKSSWIPSQK